MLYQPLHVTTDASKFPSDKHRMVKGDAWANSPGTSPGQKAVHSVPTGTVVDPKHEPINSMVGKEGTVQPAENK